MEETGVYYDAEIEKPRINASGAYKGQSDPVEAIDRYGFLHHVIWDGTEWHEFYNDGSEETFGGGLVFWRYLPLSWIYDSDFYSIGENRCQNE